MVAGHMEDAGIEVVAWKNPLLPWDLALFEKLYLILSMQLIR